MDRTNGRTSNGKYKMKYTLVNKRTQEVVDRLDVVKSEEQIAREVFQNNKQLDKESFDKLYEVKKDDRN